LLEESLLVRVDLDTQTASLPLDDLYRVAAPGADLVEDRLARNAELPGGVVEFDVSVGDARQEPFAADRHRAHPKLAGGLHDRNAADIRRRGAGGMFARSRIPRTRLCVNASPVGLFHSCFESTIAISRSDECTASRRTRSTSSGRVPDRFTVLCLARTGSSVRAPPCQISSTLAVSRAVDVQDDVVEQRAQEFLALRSVVLAAFHTVLSWPARRRSARRSGLAQRCGTMPVKLGEREPLALDIGKRLLIGALETTSDQPVLRLARIELPAPPPGLILVSFHREQLQVPPRDVVGLELLHRRRGRVHTGRVTASKNASTTVSSNRIPPIVWQTWLVACVR
jgi:hypothetical protein